MLPIFDARIMLRVKTLAQLRQKQAKTLASMRAFGIEAVEVEVSTPAVARLEGNRWLLDCLCGSGVAVNPGWPEARCMGEACGRVYTNVQIPVDRAEIEAALLTLPPAQRYWYPGETAADVVGKASADEIWTRHTAHIAKREAP